MRRAVPAAVVVVGLLGACASESAEVTGTAGGRGEVIHLPATDGPHDVIIAFHGYGGAAGQLEPLGLEDSGAIVLHAQGEEGAWAGAPYAVTSMEEDVAYARALVDAVKKDHEVRDVYGVGYSNGGGFVHALDCAVPGMFAATVTIAPAYYAGALEPCEGNAVHAPRLNFHGDADEVIAVEGGQRHGEEYESSREITAGIAKQGVPATTRIFSGGHDWSGAKDELAGEILEFFGLK